ncbi:MAG: glycerol acyltransferase [Desulfobacteraceae bacterium]|nr:glycerol acyltransferase [Desulfobacteraceae bacterium]
MKHTIFDTPLINPLLRWIALFILKVLGWKTEGEKPDISKYLLIAAPHTSNWDFVITLLVAFALKLKVYIMAKKELTNWPGGFFFKWLGVIPIDRSQSTNTVDQAIQLFQENENLAVVIAPSGTRKKVMKWKSGFYHIANGAGIPIGMGFLDYARKTGGIGPLFQPTGDVETDMIAIKAFYADIEGKYPKNTSQCVPVKLTMF